MTRRSANRRRQWGAIAVGCALALTYIPSADAHPEAHGQGGWSGHAQQGAEGPEQRGEGHERPYGADGSEQSGGGQQGDSEQQSGQEGQHGGQPQGQGAPAQTQPTQAQTQSEAGGRRQQRGDGGGQHETQAETRQRTKNHERRDAESRSQAAPAGTSGAGSTTGSTVTRTPSTTASAPAPATPAATAAVSSSAPATTATPATAAPPTPAATTSPLAISGAQTGVPTHHGASHADRARHRAARRGGNRSNAAHSVTGHPAVSSPRALAVAAGAGTQVPRRGATRGGASHGAPQPHPSSHVRTSPLVTTITTIADVVPLPVRFLLGLLLSLSLALGTRSWLAAMRARRLERQRGELLEDVGLLQAALLPQTPKHLGVVGTSAAYRPADGPGAGGDFYDVFALGDGRVAVILGDISGHGRQALPHTALVRFTLRAYLEAGLSPRVAVQTAESVLERQLGGSFATVVVATYDPEERTFVYACAGHPPPLVVGSPSLGSIGPGGSAGLTTSAESAQLAGSVESITPITVCAAPPIGAGMRTGSRQTTVAMPGKAQVCFFTDGVTEARIGGELFGAARLTRALAELGPEADASQLLQGVAEATDTRSDDMAACVLNIAGGPAAPAVLLEEVEFDRETPSNRRAEQLLLACGVRRSEVPELIANARHAAGQAGTAIVELHPVAGGGPPSVKLRRDSVSHLPTALTRARSGAGVMAGATP
jgi:hypothetical protein